MQPFHSSSFQPAADSIQLLFSSSESAQEAKTGQATAFVGETSEILERLSLVDLDEYILVPRAGPERLEGPLVQSDSGSAETCRSSCTQDSHNLNTDTHLAPISLKHTVFRTFCWINNTTIRVTKRATADNRILTSDVPCHSFQASRNCDGSCLLENREHSDEPVENCPIPGCSSPDYPT